MPFPPQEYQQQAPPNGNGQYPHPAQQQVPQQAPPQQPQFNPAAGPSQYAPQGWQQQTPPQYQQQPQPPAQQQASRAILEGLRAQGLNVAEFADDQALIQSMAQALPLMQSMPQLQSLAQVGQQALAAGFNPQQLAGPGGDQEVAVQQQATQAAQAAAANGWQAPEYDPAWFSYVRIDEESGRYVPKNHFVSPVAAQKLNTFLDWKRDFDARLVRNPEEVFKPIFESREKKLVERIREELRAEKRQADNDQLISSYMQQHHRELYVVDARGQVVRDGLNRPVMTAYGQAFVEAANRAESSGANDPRFIVQYAEQAARGAVPQQPQGQPQGQLQQPGPQGQPQAQPQQPQGRPQQQPVVSYNEQYPEYPQQPQGQPQQQPQYQQPQYPAQPAAPQYQQPPLPQDPRDRYLQRAIESSQSQVGGEQFAPPRDATVASAAEARIAQNDGQSFSQMMTDLAKGQGIDLHSPIEDPPATRE